jgi:hypothetical protein
MDFRTRYLEILEFLQPYQRIWQNEIMLQYPQPVADYPTEWLDELLTFQDKAQLMGLERKDVTGCQLSPSLQTFYNRIYQLEQVPVAPQYPPMPETSFTFLYVIPKKQHEVRRLAPLVDEFYRQHQIERIVDIGGGIGILSQTLNNQYGHRVTTLDANPTLQATGSSRHQKNAKNPENRVEYINLRVEASSGEFQQLLAPNRMTVGLHTCGPLALDQITASVEQKVKAIINLGCCFHQLEEQSHQNISQFAREHGSFYQNRFALTLAARGHRKLDEKDFDLKQKVKRYRYAMHFLLHDEYNLKEMVTLGNSRPKLYDESFGTYALEQFPRIGVTARHTKEELDAFFNRSACQELIDRMLAAGLIRNALGRLLELLIHLDRLFYLEENGYEGQLWELFDEKLSPRNLCLIARKINH